MTIETKFKPTDKVFVLDCNKIWQREIIVIEIWVNDRQTGITYRMKQTDEHEKCMRDFDEKKCFASKQELIESL